MAKFRAAWWLDLKRLGYDVSRSRQGTPLQGWPKDDERRGLHSQWSGCWSGPVGCEARVLSDRCRHPRAAARDQDA